MGLRGALDSAEVIARWRRHLTGEGASPDTIRLYATGVRRFLDETVQSHPQKATPEHVDDFLAGLGKQGPARSKYLHGLRSFFVFCAARGYTKLDPTAGIKVRKVRPRPQTRLTDDELYRLFCAAWEREPKRGWALMLSFGLGTRRMELAGIRPQDITGDSVILHGKGRKTREVPIGPLAQAALKGLEPGNGTVLGVKRSTVTRWATQAAEDAGLRERVRGRTSHVFRAAFAQHLSARGVPMTVIRDLMGHESIETTNEYDVSSEEQRREAMAGH